MFQCFQPVGVSTLPLGFWRWTSGIVLLAFDFWRWAFGFCFLRWFWRWAFGIGLLALGFWRWGLGVICFTLGFSRLDFLALSGLLSLAAGLFVAPGCSVGFCFCTCFLAGGWALGVWVDRQKAFCDGFLRWLLALAFGADFWRLLLA